MTRILLATGPLLSLAVAAHAAPTVETWRPLSTTAAITGQIRLSPSRLQMRLAGLPLAVAADVPAFKADTGTYAARILRVTRPANPPLNHGDRLCSTPARWIVVWREETGASADLGMAVFSSQTQPQSIDTPGLCGTFAYTR